MRVCSRDMYYLLSTYGLWYDFGWCKTVRVRYVSESERGMAVSIRDGSEHEVWQ